jgi:hypothetical protein
MLHHYYTNKCSVCQAIGDVFGGAFGVNNTRIDNFMKVCYSITCNSITRAKDFDLRRTTMNEGTMVEEKVVQEPESEASAADEAKPITAPETEAADQAESGAARKKTTSGALKDAWKQVFGQTLSVALQGRGNVVMVRVNDGALQHLDMLVEAEITKSRSESAAFLISEGIRANRELFDRIGAITQQISDLRTQLRQEVQREIQNKR